MSLQTTKNQQKYDSKKHELQEFSDTPSMLSVLFRKVNQKYNKSDSSYTTCITHNQTNYVTLRYSIQKY